ncbi:MAG: tetratricopeptide repeat protein [Chloroflexi bacterium]|nr:tetratricopeptide repeat protein [Chloroflexota bacterium]MCI0574659.1 tetratricopeptide repeat protein [Chloroflexota bacterium]MCI0649059.1 tetratricopeptide repeat protein [Chloroflexota bacterium]MCI0725148.1 tetratricopeptide repeat protein [Chloroflexota bacterium]
MVIKRTYPRRRRGGPSCLLVLAFLAIFALSAFVIANADTVRDVVILPPTPEPTRSAASYAASAALLQEDGEYVEAIELYEQAIRADGTRVSFYIPLIELLIATNQAEEALNWAGQAAVLAPDNDQVWSSLAAAHLAYGDRLIDMGDDTNAQLEYAEAVQAARAATEINLNNAEAHAYLAGALSQLGPEQYSRAQEEADIALAIEPDNPIVRRHMATVLELQGFYPAAIEQYMLALDQAPDMVELHIGLAYNYYATRDIPTAILTFQDALEINSNSAAAYDGLGWMYFLIGEYPTAQENLIKAVELDPEMVRAHAHLGAAYYRNLNYDEAIPELEWAVERYQQVTVPNSTYFLMLGLAYYFKNESNCDQSVPLFQQVLTVIPDEPNSLEGLELCHAAELGSSPGGDDAPDAEDTPGAGE